MILLYLLLGIDERSRKAAATSVQVNLGIGHSCSSADARIAALGLTPFVFVPMIVNLVGEKFGSSVSHA